MTGLHEKQRKILEHLLSRQEGATLDDLAARLEVTRTAVQQHVTRLLDLGYLTFADTRGSVGRPRRRYSISDQGIDAFPKKYSWLANAILAHLATELGAGGAKTFMKELGVNVARSLEGQLGPSASPGLRLKKVAGLMNDLGYRAALRRGPTPKLAVIEAVNCVYHAVAKQHPELCQFDLSLIETASGMGVRLDSCIAKGASVCRFCITKKL